MIFKRKDKEKFPRDIINDALAKHGDNGSVSDPDSLTKRAIMAAQQESAQRNSERDETLAKSIAQANADIKKILGVGPLEWQMTMKSYPRYLKAPLEGLWLTWNHGTLSASKDKTSTGDGIKDLADFGRVLLTKIK